MASRPCAGEPWLLSLQGRGRCAALALRGFGVLGCGVRLCGLAPALIACFLPSGVSKTAPPLPGLSGLPPSRPRCRGAPRRGHSHTKRAVSLAASSESEQAQWSTEVTGTAGPSSRKGGASGAVGQGKG